MSKSVPFVTRARTLDHLGREQIADCPTAISELWKNAFDAYARNVSLHVISGDATVAAIVDDGHGMNQDEFINKWLVIGTESKKVNVVTDIDDRNGLEERPKQGQKGIGRLSCAIMGSLLLIISKRRKNKFVASLVDWRLFENPYLFLHDIQIPVEEFDTTDELASLLPSMYSMLRSNLYGDERDENRRERIIQAWISYSSLEQEGEPYQLDLTLDNQSIENMTTVERIELSLEKVSFNSSHFSKWDVWNGLSNHGTALFVAEVNDDIEAQLIDRTVDSTVAQAKAKFIDTLSNFSELLVSRDEDIFKTYKHLEDDELLELDEEEESEHEFNHKVILWREGNKDDLISSANEFSSKEFDLCEHLLSGYVDSNGVFNGKIKSFGELRGDVEVLPNIAIPSHARSRVGGFYITVASYENLEKNTTLDGETWSYLNEISEQYSGFLVYRDSLRVMPYGRDDNDFFEIEARRSKNAGQFHYSNRNIFGRVMIAGEDNKNLRDKAGREGFIDNKSAKIFKSLVQNILISVANRYIGRNSEVRKYLQPILNTEYNAKKAKYERQKKKKQDQKRFIKNLIANRPKMIDLNSEVDDFYKKYNDSKELYDEGNLSDSLEDVVKYKKQLSKLKFSGLPNNLGKHEEIYRSFRDQFTNTSELLSKIQENIGYLQEALSPKSPQELIRERIESSIKHYKKDIGGHISSLKSELSSEISRLEQLTEGSLSKITLDLEKTQYEVTNNLITLQQGFTEVDSKVGEGKIETDTLFNAYSLAIDNLKNDIDLNAIASYDVEEFEQLQNEVIRLNSLAQLGITVEIIGHELAHLDGVMFDRLHRLVNSTENSNEISVLKQTYEGISGKFKFLSPLRLSGSRIKERISGAEIGAYISEFFKDLLAEHSVSIEFSERFKSIEIREEKSRVFPVFVNLINNSRYWVCQKPGNDRKIKLDVVDGNVMVSDDGPGVDRDDIKSLFTIFFTKKASGGRGIGLYLCRANLAVGGHKIDYVTDDKIKLLPGANFSISFKGLING
ncbi:ATP-binding protein [Vibrio cyclitrophicus]|uniref:ATP-binding protein n=1 Tax=Vibrio cyclitrophicus TaxID=47951 RepID=UPI0039AF85B9